MDGTQGRWGSGSFSGRVAVEARVVGAGRLLAAVTGQPSQRRQPTSGSPLVRRRAVATMGDVDYFNAQKHGYNAGRL